MTKKPPQGKLLQTTNFEFSLPDPVQSQNTLFSPVIPVKSKGKTVKNTGSSRVQSAKVLKKPLNQSQSSFASLDLNIKPNYPEPTTRGPQRPVTVKQILCEYEQEITNFNMMPLKVDLHPHILQNISQKSLSKTGKTLDLYNKGKAKTIEEIRMREKYQGKADSAVKVWLDQLAEEQGKQSKKFNKSFEAFQKAQVRLDNQLQMLLSKVYETKAKNQEAFKNLNTFASGLKEEGKLKFEGFTVNGKPTKVGKLDAGIETQGVMYVKRRDNENKSAENIQEKVELANGELISDDESFINQIPSPEDFEVLSESEM